MPIHRVKRVLEYEVVPTAKGAKYWNNTTIRDIILDDVYKPHSNMELEALVTPEVVARLDSEERYGIWWFNRRRVSCGRLPKQVPTDASTTVSRRPYLGPAKSGSQYLYRVFSASRCTARGR